jgi:hypothetical protein
LSPKSACTFLHRLAARRFDIVHDVNLGAARSSGVCRWQKTRGGLVRKVVVSEFVSLDGVIEDPGGSGESNRGGWSFRFDRGPEGDEFKFDELAAADALLLGRVTYDYAGHGVLTPALDWCLRSRYDPTPFRHRPVGIVGVSPGGRETARGQMVLRRILLHPPAYVMPEPQMLIPLDR